MMAEALLAASAAFKTALIERALGAEFGHYLSYRLGAERPQNATTQRNGKTVLTDDGPLRLETPRDRDGSFVPILIPKHARRFMRFDD
jgi:putative transposase